MAVTVSPAELKNAAMPIICLLYTSKGLAATASSTAATNGHGAIYVNSKGERVVSEVGTLSDITNATVAQEDKILYLVMDEEAYAEMCIRDSGCPASYFIRLYDFRNKH